MKPITIITACAALLAASAGSWAQTPDDGRTFGNGVLPDYLAMYDIDDSGDLSIDEVAALNADRTNPNRHRKFRQQWDSNNDGRISLTERNAAKTQIRQRIEARRNARFDAVDTGGQDGIGAADGFLTAAEFFGIAAVAASDHSQAIFDHLDKDDDNRISRAEFLQSLNTVRPSTTVTPQPRAHPDNNINGGNGD